MKRITELGRLAKNSPSNGKFRARMSKNVYIASESAGHGGGGEIIARKPVNHRKSCHSHHLHLFVCKQAVLKMTLKIALGGEGGMKKRPEASLLLGGPAFL